VHRVRARYTTEIRRNGDALLFSLVAQLLKLVLADVFELLALELVRPLERNAAFIVVGEDALQVWIAPGCAWRHILLSAC
jgi:hypothetical protein